MPSDLFWLEGDKGPILDGKMATFNLDYFRPSQSDRLNPSCLGQNNLNFMFLSSKIVPKNSIKITQSNPRAQVSEIIVKNCKETLKYK